MEQERKRQEQIREINSRINEIKLKLNNLQKEYGDMASDVIRDINRQIGYISTSGDLRVAFRQLRKVESLLKEEEKTLREDRAFYDRLKREKERKREKAKRLLSELGNIENEYKEIINDSIKQRIDSFKKAIKLNPDNEKILTQIEQFEAQLSRMYAEFLEKEENKRYVANAFGEILGGSVDEGDGGFSVSGSIDGVPIKVRVGDRELNFNTPEDGSCEAAMKKIVDELAKKEVVLGPIKALKSGKVYNQVNQQVRKRIRQ
jgi:hypothetical protein